MDRRHNFTGSRANVTLEVAQTYGDTDSSYQSFAHNVKTWLGETCSHLRNWILEDMTVEGKPKRQHFVPQFLLRNFGLGKKNKAKLWVYDKFKNKCFRSSVRDVGHENRFYEATSSDGRNAEGERFTQFADHRGALAIESILRNKSIQSDSKEMGDLVSFVAVQMVRVPWTRNFLERFKQVLIDKWGPNIHASGDDRPISEFTEADSKYSSIRNLASFLEIADDLKKKIFFLTEAPPNESFIISDNPVVRHNYIHLPFRGNLGTRRSGIHIFMPLSHRYCIEFLCPEMASILSKTPSGSELLSRQNHGLPCLYSSQNVEFVNSLQVIQSERWIFAQSEKDLFIASDMVKQHPDLSIPASHKVVTSD